MEAKQVFKSKTVNFNVIVPALAGVAAACGYPVPAEVVAGILAVGSLQRGRSARNNYFLDMT